MIIINAAIYKLLIYLQFRYHAKAAKAARMLEFQGLS